MAFDKNKFDEDELLDPVGAVRDLAEAELSAVLEDVTKEAFEQVQGAVSVSESILKLVMEAIGASPGQTVATDEQIAALKDDPTYLALVKVGTTSAIMAISLKSFLEDSRIRLERVVKNFDDAQE